ncbi:hypothetical protein OQZ33_07125 [Pedobacter sp. MC2016-05]|uniref:hypothetical protein n=1 Tax=Pedobacter sp. MC2016-05 TaxID=2994474 RepID=UPI002248664A|nr:hypothetical protein [Pedobacter sp. MC2016-05]MCX2474097.1 hypothetical protein [Pedobacter sp. MC2016-05]
MVSLKTYLNFLKDFFNSHEQINTLLVGDKKDITGHSDIVYPLANIEYLDKAIKGNDDVYRFEIIIASLSTNDIELDVINDCNLIADDLVTYFSDIDKFEDLEFFNSVTMKPFTDSFGDRVSGVTFVVSMTGFRKACITSIPLKGIIIAPEEDVESYVLDAVLNFTF